MKHEVTLPVVAEGMTEAFVAQWMVEVGARVEVGDDLVEVMTDKVNTVVESEVAGTVAELLHEEEARVEPGDALLVIDVEG